MSKVGVKGTKEINKEIKKASKYVSLGKNGSLMKKNKLKYVVLENDNCLLYRLPTFA